MINKYMLCPTFNQLFACLLIIMHLLPSADFFKIKFFDFIFMKTTKAKVSNALDPDQDQSNPDQDRHFVCADLGPNCLQRLSAEDKLN